MARVKNVEGGPGDEDPRPPPRLPSEAKGKATKKLATKKRKYPDVGTARAATADLAERGGSRSGVVIADQLSPAQRATVQEVERRHGGLAGIAMVGGWCVAIDESQSQGSHSSRHSQQSRLRRDSSQRRQSRHLSHSLTALVILVPR